ncbi:4-diphosphocytidyl-2-C-methyl-D-erythritol kinase [Micromonospora sp. ATCC 39149]|nr:4-diphosphocytidyl-2-C-methyl-D-erythritol kinase [Micromonospora sp. ATCC 39149]
MRDAGAAGPPLGSTDGLLAALRQRDPRVLAATLGNDLQAAALVMRPSLATTLKAGEAAGALAGIVSGSGPTCVFLAADAADAERIAGELELAGVCREARTAHGPVAGARIG